MSHALLVLGAGPFALPVLRWAREAGLRTVLADPDSHAPERRNADEFHPIPRDDAEAHAALARRMAKAGALAGIHATTSASFALLPALAEAVPSALAPRRVLERLLAPGGPREALVEKGLPVAHRPVAGERELDVLAFLREGEVVRSGIAERRTQPNGDVWSLQPGVASAEEALAAYVLVERAARQLGIERGPLSATLAGSGADLGVVALHPGFADALGATHVARLTHGKSPLQAWLAHLAGAGGPFDEVPLEVRAAAGWLSVAPDRAGRFAGVDGQSRARGLPGLVDLWFEEPGRQLASPELETRPLGYVWARAHDREELEERLRAARAALEVRVACRQRVA